MLFISYSHKDSDFVDRLTASLVEHRVSVWVDKIEINVGDSLLEKVQGAISDADRLAVVLSKSSVKSDWCREELNAGFMRQLKEKRVVVLPLLLEECELPPFLADKKYANFAKSFDEGLHDLLATLAAAPTVTLGRRKDPEYHTDYGLDWRVHNDHFTLEIDGVSFSDRNKFSVMVKVRLVGNDVATRRYRQFVSAGLRDIGVVNIIGVCQSIFDSPESYVTLASSAAVELERGVEDPKTGVGFTVKFWIRRIGEPTGTNLVYHFGSIFGEVFRALLDEKPKLSPAQMTEWLKIISSPPK